MVIAGIEGILRSRGDDWVIIDVGGVSFRIQTPTSTLIVLGTTGEKVRLHTHLHVKDDSMALFGFASAEELKLFELLIGISGVGPRLSLSVLSSLSPERFALAVASGDDQALYSIPGLGKKTAGRIILELRGKFEQATAPIAYPQEEVRAALISLGYSAAEATSAIAAIPDSPDLKLEDKIKLALQHFARVS